MIARRTVNAGSDDAIQRLTYAVRTLDSCALVQWFCVAPLPANPSCLGWLYRANRWCWWLGARLPATVACVHACMDTLQGQGQRWQWPLHLGDKSEVDSAGWPFANQGSVFSPYTAGRIAGGTTVEGMIK